MAADDTMQGADKGDVGDVTFAFHDPCDGLPKEFDKAHFVFASATHDLDEREAMVMLQAFPSRVPYQSVELNNEMLVDSDHCRYAMAVVVSQLSERFVGGWSDKRILIARAFGDAVFGPLPFEDGKWVRPRVGEYVIYNLYEEWRDAGTATRVLETELEAFLQTFDPHDAPNFFFDTELAGLTLDHMASGRRAGGTIDDVASSIRAQSVQRSIKDDAEYWSMRKRQPFRVLSAAGTGQIPRPPYRYTEALAFVLAVAASVAFGREYIGERNAHSALVQAFARNGWFRYQAVILAPHSINVCIQ